MAERRKRRVPQCAACGRSLKFYISFATGERAERVAKHGSGMHDARGARGDGVVCNVQCGYLLAMRIIVQVPDVLLLLSKPTALRVHDFEKEQRERSACKRSGGCRG